MAYLGNTPTTQSFIEGTDYFNGTGSQTAFTLSRSVVSVNDIQATINNVVQQPSTAYTVSGTTITFTSAPSAGSSNIYVRYMSTTTQSITPSQGTVGNSQFANNISAIPMTYGTIGAGNASIMKNRIINGATLIDQRNAGAAITTSNTTQYVVDRFQIRTATGTGNTSQQNSGNAPTTQGFSSCIRFTCGTAGTVGTTDNNWIAQAIEGFNVQDLAWGTASAKTITLSFWVYSSLTGTFGGALGNSASNRSYPYTYTVSAANTWQQISVTIAGDTTGTWVTNSGLGIQVFFGLGSGSTYLGTSGAWAAADYRGATGEKQVVANSGATFYITGVQLEVGSSATGFEYRQYGQELALCQRYLPAYTDSTKSVQYIGQATSGTNAYVVIPFPVSTRVPPTGLSTASLNAIVSNSTSGGLTISALTFTQSGSLSALVAATVASGLSAGNSTFLIFNGGQLFFTGCEL